MKESHDENSFISTISFYLKKTFFNVYFWETDRMGEGQRERETQNPKQPPGSEPVSTEPHAGLEPMKHRIMTWAEVGRSTD